MKDEIYKNLENQISKVFIENKVTNDNVMLFLDVMKARLMTKRIFNLRKSVFIFEKEKD